MLDLKIQYVYSFKERPFVDGLRDMTLSTVFGSVLVEGIGNIKCLV